MKKIALLAAVIIFLAMPFFVNKKNNKANDVVSQKTPIRVDIAKKNNIAQTFNVIGELEAINDCAVIPKISGRIEAFELEDGTIADEMTPVKKGQVFAILENDELKLQVMRSEGIVNSAKAALEIAEINFEDKAKDKTRMENLFEKGAITEKQNENAKNDYERSKIQVLQSKAQLQQAEASYELDRIRLNNSYITSPIDGVIAQRYLQEGDMASLAKPITSIISMDEMKLMIGVPVHSLSDIERENVDVSLEINDQLFPAAIHKIYPKLDLNTRMVTIEIRINNPFEIINDKKSYLLRPGMMGKAVLKFEKNNQTVTAPKNALIHLDGKYYVFLYQDGIAKRTEVNLGVKNENIVEILEGIKEGDKIIIDGHYKITNGSEVKEIISGE